MHPITRATSLPRDRNSHLCLYRSILDHMLDVVILVDPVGMVVYLNPAADRLLGSLRLASSLDAFFAAVHPEDVRTLRSAVDDVLAGGLSPVIVEHRCRAVLGGWRIYETHVQRLLSDGVDTVLLVCRDITVQRATESQRTEGHAFEVAAQASGAVARDFGTLLLSLGRHLDALTGATIAEVPQEMRELRETLTSAWLLVEQLQSFGASDPRPHRTDVNDTLEALSLHLRRLAGPSAEVIQLLGATATRITMSRADLEELLSALVLRARDALRASAAMHPREIAGAGRIVLVTRDGEDHAGKNGQPSAADTVLECIDNGIPMTDDERGQIQFGAGPAGDGHLARIHALVQKAGGTITADAAEAGTTIRVRCPRSGPAESGD